MQGDAPFRMQPEDLDRWYVRNAQGEMVPFSAFASGEWTYGSPKLERFNGVAVDPDPGRRRRRATAPARRWTTMERLAAQLPPGIGVEWTGLSYEERLSGAQAPLLYALSLLVVFLCLAALYESWSIPIAVMLVVPLGVLGAVIAATCARLVERRLLPGRPADDDRPRGEERDPDRRVRQGDARQGVELVDGDAAKRRACACGRS